LYVSNCAAAGDLSSSCRTDRRVRSVRCSVNPNDTSTVRNWPRPCENSA
jgi:hypothetical protein